MERGRYKGSGEIEMGTDSEGEGNRSEDTTSGTGTLEMRYIYRDIEWTTGREKEMLRKKHIFVLAR